MKVLKNVPKNIGVGEGGNDLAKLYEVIKQIDEALADASGGDIDPDDFVKTGDLDDYAKKAELSNKADSSDLDNYAKKSELSNKADSSDLDDYAKKSALNDKADKSDLSDKANESDLKTLEGRVDELEKTDDDA